MQNVTSDVPEVLLKQNNRKSRKPGGPVYEMNYKLMTF